MTTTQAFPHWHIVAPAYNEEKDLPVWLGSLASSPLRRWLQSVVIVDDGSRDRTVKVARSFQKKLPITIISYTPNAGPGFAFRKGLTSVLRVVHDNDVIVTMECDNTSDLSILSEMVKKVQKGAGVCVASYFARGGGFTDTPWWRMFVSTVGNFLVRNICGMYGVHTFSSFYRVYNPAALRRLEQRTNGRFFEERGFACMVEMLARLAHQGERLSEVPMILVSSKRRGVSKMRQIPTILGYFRVMLRSLSW